MPSAARVGDETNHPGAILGPGVETVLIDGLPASVVGDEHVCSFPSDPPHPSTPILVGSTSVTIGGKPAARVGDQAGCGAEILTGAASVVIGG
jgi:uncharacterized Zn-binding protein involved in type VI secretion